MWDLPRPGLEPVSPALAGRFLTTAPPGKPHSFILCFLSGTVYLDHAGATLFPQSQLTSFTKDLMENVYGKEKHSTTDFALNVSQLHSANISMLNKMSH